MKIAHGLIVLAAVFAIAPWADAQSKKDPLSDIKPKRLKMRLAVAPLDWGDRTSFDNFLIPVEIRTAINAKLEKRLFDTGRFVILERDEMEAIKDEKAIKEETTGQSQKGKTVFAQGLVRGQITNFELARRGGGGGISVGGFGIGASTSSAEVGMSVRIFDVDTSRLLSIEEAKGSASATGFTLSGGVGSVFGSIGAFEKTPLGEATSKAIDAAVRKIVNKFEDQPWQAKVADFDKDAKEITINAGSELGVRVGDEFDVLRVGRVIKDPDTGEVIGVRTTKAGKIKITQVEKRLAFATVVDGTEFQTGDIVREIK